MIDTKIQDFELDIYNPNTDSVIKQNISSFESKWLVLFFYPADFTFVCPTELKDLNDSYDAIKSANAEVLVISTDTVYSHKRWVETERLLQNFKILMGSDRKCVLSKYLGLLNDENGNAHRGTIIISPEGIIKSIEIVSDSIGRSSIELIRKLNALEYVNKNPGYACPASWNIGSKTLKPSINIAGHVAEQLD